jgi:hypothetical protein
MPVVSINLSPSAYLLYQSMEKGGRSRRLSYVLERNFGLDSAQQWENCPRCRGKIAPMVEIGDRRVSGFGDSLVWTMKGWKLFSGLGEEE